MKEILEGDYILGYSGVFRLMEIYFHLPDEQRQKVMVWVSRIDVLVKQSDVANIHQPETGEWLLSSDIFREWERGIGRALGAQESLGRVK